MKKIMVIGDLHGRNVWKNFADISYLLQMEDGNKDYDVINTDYDYYVFIGDYCDAFDKTNNEIRENLLEVLKFKDMYPRQVILLWGNHELHYVLDTPWNPEGKYECSGKRHEMHFDLYEIFNKNFEKFQMAFQYDNYLFTHAGVHTGWYHERFVPEFKQLEDYLNELEIEFDNETLADKLNIAFVHRMTAMFDVGHRRGGHARVGGPLWLDKQLAIKPLKGYHQVVGHTATYDIHTFTKNEDTTITFIDVLHKRKAFYNINIK